MSKREPVKVLPFLLFAGEEVDVVVAARRGREHHAMGMKCCRRDRGAAVCVQKARIRLEA
jgi:hypothetical protein